MIVLNNNIFIKFFKLWRNLIRGFRIITTVFAFLILLIELEDYIVVANSEPKVYIIIVTTKHTAVVGSDKILLILS